MGRGIPPGPAAWRGKRHRDHAMAPGACWIYPVPLRETGIRPKFAFVLVICVHANSSNLGPETQDISAPEEFWKFFQSTQAPKAHPK